MIGTDHGQTVSTVQLFHSGLERHGQILQILEFVIQQMGDDFGVGVRGEHVARRLQAGAQFLMVLDDAVMHHGQAIGDVRMGIAFGGHAVGGPARVGDADAGRELAGVGQRSEVGNATR